MSELEIWIYRGLIVGLVTIILGVIRYFYNKSEKHNEGFELKMTNILEKLNTSVVELDKTIALQSNTCLNMQAKVAKHDEEIKILEKVTIDHDKDLSVIKATIGYDRKNG